VSKQTWKRVAGAAAELRVLADELSERLNLVLAQAGVRERFRNDPSSPVVVITGDPWAWVFTPESLPVRQSATQLLDRWEELGRRVLSAIAPETVDDFARHEPVLRAPLDLSDGADGPGAPEPAGAAQYVREALAAQVGVMDRVLGADVAAEMLWLVPDTNSLLKTPALELWEGDQPVTIVIVPQVMRELDGHKLHHRNPDVRAKAQELIRRFDGYGRRGDTFDGVTIVGSLTYRELAVDADVHTSLSWLRPEHADDQLLASVLELRWQNPRVAVTLVTEDRNLRNKARLAQIATDRAPTPTVPSQQRPASTRAGQRPIVRVKSVRVAQRRPASPLGESQRPLNILVVDLVNVGERSAFDAVGMAQFHPWGDGGRTPLGSFQMPALEAGGTWTVEFTLALPPPGTVTALSVTIEGTCHDVEGSEHPLG
jgi:hypothetical protein